ncbi:hypothetical protein EZS27_011344 [termite gut metagenome]|uniref:Uncharacterized protein n=1 Tax=termite gut metagenome TaxID=433724 RepID=A0A5J4S406_9ZZZZ
MNRDNQYRITSKVNKANFQSAQRRILLLVAMASCVLRSKNLIFYPLNNRYLKEKK